MQCCNYTPEDIFWGQLGGCLEALDAGTTTIVDHAHMNYSSEHSKSSPALLWKKVAEEKGGGNNALSATISSGIRSIFGYSPTPLVKSWSPLIFEESLLPDWMMEQLDLLLRNAPFGDGRVQLGLAFDGYFLPKGIIVNLFKKFRDGGGKLITSHYGRGAIFGMDCPLEILVEQRAKQKLKEN